MPDVPRVDTRSLSERPLWQLTVARLKEFLREPEAIFWTFMFPIILAVGLGIAFRNKPADVIAIAVVKSAATRDSLTATLAKAAGLRVASLDDTAAARALRTGDVALVARATAAGVEYQYDDTRPEGRSARALIDDAVQRAAGRRDPVTVSERKVQEKGSRYIDFVVPGLLGMNIMGGGIWGLGFAIVEARRRNLLKRFVATPMRRTEYLMSFLLSRFVFLVLEIAALLGCTTLFFGVPIRGSIVQLAIIAVLSALAFGGMGLLIASRARTMEGVSGLMNLIMMPMWVLSGVFFASTNFPAAAQPFIQALPLTAANNALRATMLQGAGWSTVAPSLAIIAVWLVVSFSIALKLFKWR